MTERSDVLTLVQLFTPWAVCALLAALVPSVLTWLNLSEWLRRPWPITGLVSLAYWGPGLLSVFSRRNMRRGMNGRERAAEFTLQVVAGLLLFAVPSVATLLELSSRLDITPFSSWSEVEDILGRRSEIRGLLKMTIWTPLGAVILATVAWGMRRTPTSLYAGGLSLVWWLVAMTAYYAPFADTAHDRRARAHSVPAAPLCTAERFTMTPRNDPDSPTGVYIPKDLDEAIVELDRALPACAVPQILKVGPFAFHHSLGMWMRNNYGLWHHSCLARYFNEMGIHHPDDMSGIILTSYYRQLRRQPLRVEDQVALYQAYWQLIKKGWRPWNQLE